MSSLVTRLGLVLAAAVMLTQAGACVAQDGVRESVGSGEEPADDPIENVADQFAGSPFIDFAESTPHLSSITFRSPRQAARVMDQMGAVLATADPFQLLTVLSEAVLATCRSARPDLPDIQISPEDLADRVGTLTVAVFSESQVNFSFRTTDKSPEYVITVDGSQSQGVRISSGESGETVALVSGARMMLIRDAVESFTCSEGGDFEVTLAR